MKVLPTSIKITPLLLCLFSAPLFAQEPSGASNQQPQETTTDRTGYLTAVGIKDLPVSTDNLTVIRPGMRGVSFSLSAESTDQRIIGKDSIIDLIVTYTQDGALTSKRILDQVKIVKIDKPESIFESNQINMILELTPEDSLKLKTAQKMGEISIDVRAKDDYSVSESQEHSQ